MDETGQDHPEREPAAREQDDRPGSPGAEGGSDSPSKDRPPAAPADDDAPLGDTDQHSNA